VTVKEMERFEKGELQKEADKTERERAKQIEQFVEEGSYINLPQLSRSQLKQVSQVFKAKKREIRLCHVLDRQFDGVDYFEFIDQELEDEFVIRAKVSRNSKEVKVDQETNETVAVKLKEVDFGSSQTDVIAKLRVKKKVYQDAKRLVEWGTLELQGHDYTVVRVTLMDRPSRQSDL